MDEIIGLLPNKENSVGGIRKLREELSKEKFNLEEINNLAD